MEGRPNTCCTSAREIGQQAAGAGEPEGVAVHCASGMQGHSYPCFDSRPQCCQIRAGATTGYQEAAAAAAGGSWPTWSMAREQVRWDIVE